MFKKTHRVPLFYDFSYHMKNPMVSLLCWFDHFLYSRAEICQIFRWFFGKFKISKRHSEINWPLANFFLLIGFIHQQHLHRMLMMLSITSSERLLRDRRPTQATTDQPRWHPQLTPDLYARFPWLGPNLVIFTIIPVENLVKRPHL